MKNLLLFFLCLSANVGLLAQTVEDIKFYNPSFEDLPRASRAPRGWINCGWEKESAPDTQPDPTFKVYQQASNGDSYLGMVTRDNDTWEAVGQKLADPLKSGNCYQFSLDLSRSESYISRSQLTGEEVNYNEPCILKVWGGEKRCERMELLSVSEPIRATDWVNYIFVLTPKKDLKFILYEITYPDNVLFPTNGNMLIDNLSVVKKVDCKNKE